MSSPTRDRPAVLAEYERHLVSERDLAPHTVRAYLSDVAGLLDHAGRLGIHDVAALDLRTLRSWLARQQVTGHSRTTLARRATAVRVFTAWLARTGRIPVDIGATLRSPKPHRALPPVLRQDEARELIDAATRLADDGSPIGVRDVAMLELLYATGVRVGELVGLDVDDVDRSRNVVRVFGKGRKERTVPFGHPAAAAVDAWLRLGRPRLVVPGAGAALFVGTRGRRIDQRAVRTRCRGRPGHRAARSPAHRGDPPAGGRRGPALGPGAARPRLPGHHPALHPRQHRPAAAGLPAGPPESLSTPHNSRGLAHDRGATTDRNLAGARARGSSDTCTRGRTPSGTARRATSLA